MTGPAVAPGPRVPPQAMEQLLDITSSVFASMVGDGLCRVPRSSRTEISPAQIAGTVAFAGAWTGYVSVVTSSLAARRITAALLGMDDSEVDAQVHDALGEVVNMLAGGFRTRMVQPGEAWAITVPLVATGEALSLAHPREAFHGEQWFRFQDQLLEVHLVVTSLSSDLA